MRILVGLGNPGNRYRLTRHNIGFIFLDYIADKASGVFRPGKGDYFYCSLNLAHRDILLVKPTTFMNRSGLAVEQVLDETDSDISDLLIIYDDFQLPFGSIRFRPGGSSGGHKGMESVIYYLQTDRVPRLRFGIGSQEMASDAVDFVLSDFSEQELKALPQILQVGFEGVVTWLQSGIEQAMNGFNRRVIDNKTD